MKHTFGLFVLFLFVGAFTAQAQGGGGMQRRTVEERVKSVMEKMVDLKLDKDKTTQVDSVFAQSFRAQDKMMEEMRAAGGQPDREKMMAQRQKMMEDRDAKLKKVLTDAQFKKWKDEIEPTTRQQRGGGGGGRPGGNPPPPPAAN